jgi:hypothetical protein
VDKATDHLYNIPAQQRSKHRHAITTASAATTSERDGAGPSLADSSSRRPSETTLTPVPHILHQVVTPVLQGESARGKVPEQFHVCHAMLCLKFHPRLAITPVLFNQTPSSVTSSSQAWTESSSIRL